MEDEINFVVVLMAALLLLVLWRIVVAMIEKRRMMKNDGVSGEGMEKECSFCREKREE